MQKARRHAQTRAPTACGRRVSGTLSLFSTKCFSPFPHGTLHYRSHGSVQPCRADPADSRRITRVPRYSGSRGGGARFAHGPVTLCGGPFQSLPLARSPRTCAVLQPPARPSDARGLGTSPFARRYWGIHCCLLFLRVLRCFSSPRSPRAPQGAVAAPTGRRVLPFGHPGVKGRLRLARDYRSLPRPSSPP